MREDIKVPPAGESVHEGDIARWYKEDGDIVKRDEPLAELETDKASQDITAPADGRLTIVETEGTTVEVGQIIGYIEPADEAEAPTSPAADAPADEDDHHEDEEEDKAKHSTLFNFQMPSPAARKILAEHNISAKDVPATGRGDRLTKADVLRFLESQEKVQSTVTAYRDKLSKAIEMKQAKKTESAPKAPAPAAKAEAPAAPAAPAAAPAPAKPAAPAPVAPKPVPGARGKRTEKMTRMRKTISQRLVAAQQSAALLTTFNEVDMGAIMDLRKQFKDEFKEKHQVGLGFMSFFTKAVCQALIQFPIINAQVDGDELLFHDYCDIGIAVSTPKGLVVPVIRNAESLSLREIESAVIALALRGRDGSLSIEDMSGGTFSITNGGTFGSMLSTPIVNAPQSAILGMHNIVERPVARNGQVVIRPVMYVALTYDHRLIDGSDAVRFLVKVKTLLEDPVRLMLEL